MSDTIKPPSSLSEISHLFLSTLREKHTGPKRIPPASRIAAAASIDLTPEEFDKVALSDTAAVSAPVTAVLASHLEDGHAAIAAYAQHLVAHNQRVGVIEIDADELRLSCLATGSSEGAREASAYFEPRHLAEAIEELNADIDRWLVVVKNPRLDESRAVLRKISHWMLISSCDSEGIVAAYRSLKALSPLGRPRLSIGLLDAANAEQAERVYRKIGSVCDQFLHWPIERGPSVRVGIEPDIHTIMHWKPPHESSAPGAHWQVIETFLSRRRNDEADISPEEHQEISSPALKGIQAAVAPIQAAVCGGAVAGKFSEPGRSGAGEPDRTPAIASAQNSTPILSLLASDAVSVLNAVLQHHQDLIACPVPLPMCETARLTVGRDRRLLLLAVAGKDLGNLRAIGYAYRWLTENRQLVAMAVPQLSIDATVPPKLRLLIDHADRDVQALDPIMQNPLIEMQQFRTLNWSGRLGLLLEAA